MKYIYLLVIFIIPLMCFSQYDIAINPAKLDLRLAEYFLKEQINEIRKQAGADSLMNDSILFEAAAIQSNYLNNQEKLDNKNPIKKYATPSLRVDACGAKNYIVTEKISRTPFHVGIRKTALDNYPSMVLTYRQLAAQICNTWSIEKYIAKDLTDKSFRFVASNITFNSETYEFTTVLLFARVGKAKKINNCKQCFPYDTNPPNKIYPDSLLLKMNKESDVKSSLRWPEDDKVCSDMARSAASVSYHNGYLICKYSQAEILFKSRRSGLMMEYIDLSSMHNNNFYEMPSRRNGKSIFNGEPSEYKSRAALFREAKNNYPRDTIEIFGWKSFFLEKPDYFKIKLPQPDDLMRSKNVIYINKNKVCKIDHNSNIYYEMFNVPVAKVPYESNLPHRDYPLKKVKDSTNAIVDTLNFTIWFKKNESAAKQEELKPVIAYFKDPQNRSVIKSIKVEAYASVEGNEQMNQNLYKRRAENFIEIFKEYLDTALITNITTQENWALFEEQIPDSKFKTLKGKNKEELREWVNKRNKDEDVEALLGKQRYAYVQMVTRKVDTLKLNTDTLAQYRNMVNRYNSEITQTLSPRMSNKGNVFQHLRDIQLSLYTGYKQGKVNLSQLDSLNTKVLLENLPAENAVFVQLIYDKMVFDYLVAKRYPMNQMFYDACRSLIELKATDRRGKEKQITKGAILANTIYNKQAYLVNHYDSFFYDDMGKYELFYQLNNKKKAKVPNTDFELNQSIYININNFAKEAQKHGASSLVADSLKAHYYLNSIIDYYTYDYLYFSKEINRMLPAIDRYFIKGKQLTAEDKIKFARFYIAFGETKEVLKLLEPLVKAEEPNHDALVVYLKYSLSIDSDIDKYYPVLQEASKLLSKEEWCNMFTGLEHLSYSVLENGKLRALYCKTCGCN